MGEAERLIQHVVLYERPGGGIVAYATAYTPVQQSDAREDCRAKYGRALLAEARLVNPDKLTT